MWVWVGAKSGWDCYKERGVKQRKKGGTKREKEMGRECTLTAPAAHSLRLPETSMGCIHEG